MVRRGRQSVEIMMISGWVWVALPLMITLMLIELYVPVGEPVEVESEAIVVLGASDFSGVAKGALNGLGPTTVQPSLNLTPLWLGGAVAAVMTIGLARGYAPWAKLVRPAVLLAFTLVAIALAELLFGARASPMLHGGLWAARFVVLVSLSGFVLIPMSIGFVKIGRNSFEILPLLTLASLAIVSGVQIGLPLIVDGFQPGLLSKIAAGCVIALSVATSIAGIATAR